MVILWWFYGDFVGFYRDSMGYYWDVPSGYVKIAIENGPVEIVDFPSYKMVDLSIVM